MKYLVQIPRQIIPGPRIGYDPFTGRHSAAFRDVYADQQGYNHGSVATWITGDDVTWFDVDLLAAESTVTLGDRLFVANGGGVLREYTLTGQRVSETHFTGYEPRLLRLASGGVLCAAHLGAMQVDPDVGMNVELTYLPPNGTQWSSKVYPMPRPEYMPVSSVGFVFSVAQDADGAIIVICCQDAQWFMPRAVFREQDGMILMESFDPAYIAAMMQGGVQRDGDMAKAGEFAASLQLAFDPFQKRVIAVYQRDPQFPFPGEYAAANSVITNVSVPREQGQVPDKGLQPSQKLALLNDPVGRVNPSGMCIPYAGGVFGGSFRSNGDGGHTWVLRKFDLSGVETQPAQEMPWNHNSPWSDTGWVFYSETAPDGSPRFWIENLGITWPTPQPPDPTPIPPDPQPPDPTPIPPDPIPVPPDPQPLPPLNVAVVTNRPRYRKKDKCIITVTVGDIEDVKVNLTVAFAKQSVEFTGLLTDETGTVVQTVKITPNYGVGPGTVIATATKADYAPGTAKTSFLVTA